jgi:YVTN family beta-propeller protein
VSAAGPQPRIFISYRRDDSQGFARSIHDRLAQRFGPDAVFRDINDIEPGRPWAEAIDDALASCDVFVLLIGRGWLAATDDEGNRRLDDPEDRHRREIETAVNRRIRIFVALMEDAHMPRRKELPQGSPGEDPRGLQVVPALHALRIADHAFDYGIGELVTNIERAAEQAHVSEEARQRATAEERQRQAEEQQRAEEDERKHAEETAEEQRSAEAEERRRAEEQRKRAAEERKPAEDSEVTTDREEGRRRLLTLAGVGLGVLAVVVVAFLIVSSGDEDGSATVVEPEVEVGEHPVDLAHSEDGLWVTNRVGRSVSLVDEGDPAELIRTWQLDGEPEGVAVGAGLAFVANREGDEVWRIDPNEGVRDARGVGSAPSGVAVNGGATLWVTDFGSNTVSRIVGDGARESIDVRDEPYGVAIGDDGAAWVTNRGDNSVSRIGPTSTTADDPITVGLHPRGIDVSADTVWVANTEDGDVTRIDLNGGEPERFEVGTLPRGVVVAFGSVWVTNGGSDSVTRLDAETGEEIQIIDVGAAPEGIAAGSDSVWVANGGDNTVTRIDPGT